MRPITAFLAVTAALCLTSVSASAQTVGSVTAEALETVLEEAGLNPNMTEDAVSGAPVAQGTAGEIQFWIRALNCSGTPKACENLVFFANFDLGRDITTTDYKIINNFNDSQVFGRAYILEKKSQIGVDYVIDLGGGVTPAHLTQNISRWADVMAAFVKNFSEGNTGA